MTFPIGTILPYVVSLLQPPPDHWLFCNGGALDNDENETLAGIIAPIYGTDGSNFYLPDYRGRFLRGVDGGANVDPDALKRTAPTSESNPGNSGDNIGSIQACEYRSHSHDYTWYPDHVVGTVEDNNTISKDDSETCDTDSFGGSESRPKNISFSFVIKSDDQDSFGKGGEVGDTPIGAIIAYAGNIDDDLSQMGWLPCDGTSYTVADYNSLYNVLGDSAGAKSPSEFSVPDLQGMFLRGQDNGADNDPEAGLRSAPRTDLSNQGITGDNPCSYQEDKIQSHTHSYSTFHHSNKIQNDDEVQFMDHDTESVNTDSFGRNETRPVNIALNFFICYDNENTDKGIEFDIPTGAVVAYGGDVAQSLEDAGWLYCDGSLLDGSQSAYSNLYKMLGKTMGGDTEEQFYLPDIRGRFVRGVDNEKGNDPDAEDRTAPQPNAPYNGNKGDMVGTLQQDDMVSHVHGFESFYSRHHGDAGEFGDHFVLANTETNSTSSDGGNETRPVNIYTNWLIYAKPEKKSDA